MLQRARAKTRTVSDVNISLFAFQFPPFLAPKLQLCRMNKSRGLMHTTMITVNDVVSNTGNLLRE